MAMSIFQRRLASSTYALMRSFARRLDKLHGLIEAMQSGQLTTEQLLALQRHAVHDVLEEKTADEESREDEREENEIEPDAVTFLAHALVVPSSDPEDRKRHDEQIEAIAVKVAWAHEEACGAVVKDVSTPAFARAAGLPERPGFDLLSLRPSGEERGIEVKGRAGIGDIEITENEWAKACNLRERYWLYVVYECATAHPRLLRIQDPFGKLIVRAKGSVIIDEPEIFAVAEGER